MVDKKVSIVVPVRYRHDLTKVCLDTIKLYTDNYELIPVQEGEDAEITELLKQEPNFLHNETPKGYSGALNTGLKVATGDYICFMNNDTVATPGWMDNMLKAFDHDDHIGLVVPTFWGSGGRQSVDWNDERTVFDYISDIMSVIGVCFLVKRQVIEDIGEWDETFFHGGEDFDFAYRLQQAGHDIVIARKSFIYHYGGASTRILFDNDIEKVRDNARKKLTQFALKHNLDVNKLLEKVNLSNKI